MTPRFATLLLALLALAAALPTSLASEHVDEEDPRDDRDEDTSREAEEKDKARDEDKEDAEDDEDQEWEDDERELDLRTDADGFVYESRRESPLGKDEIRASFDARDARFRFEYLTEGDDDEAAVTFRVDFVSLIEHEDADGDRVYDIGETVHRRTALTDLAPTVVGARNGSVELVDVTYRLPGGGALTLRFYVTPIPLTVAGVPLAPTEAKYDIIIRDYAWSAGASRLALETRMRTRLEADYDEADEGQPGIEFGAGHVAGFHRWLNMTEVDGRIEPVGATVLTQKTTQGEEGLDAESVVVFSYAQGASITHDPSFGVERLKQVAGALAETVRGDWRTFGLALAVSAALVASTAIPRLRRRE